MRRTAAGGSLDGSLDPHSKPRQQTALAIGCTIVGALILYGARGFQTLNSNAGAGSCSASCCFGLGIAAFLVSGRQSVTIDPTKRTIRIDDEGRLGRKSHTLRFDDIADIGIGYLGKKSNYVTWYYLNLLKNGKEYPCSHRGVSTKADQTARW